MHRLKLYTVAMLDASFWSTVATVLPVLALAIVVEARSSISRWTEDYPARMLRTVQGILWAIPLVLFIYLEPISFQALEGSHPSRFSISLVGPTVSASLAVLVLNPGLELLLRSNAWIVVKGIAAFNNILVLWYSRRRLRRVRGLVRRITTLQRQELIHSAKLYSLEYEAQSWSESDEKKQLLAELAESRDRVNGNRNLLEESRRDAADLLARILQENEELKKIPKREALSRLETALTQMNFDIDKVLEKAFDESSSEEETSSDLRVATNTGSVKSALT